MHMNIQGLITGDGSLYRDYDTEDDPSVKLKAKTFYDIFHDFYINHKIDLDQFFELFNFDLNEVKISIKADEFGSKKIGEIERLLNPPIECIVTSSSYGGNSRADPDGVKNTKLILNLLVKKQMVAIGMNRITEDMLDKTKSYLEQEYGVEVDKKNKEIKIHPKIFVGLLTKLADLFDNSWGFRMVDKKKVQRILNLDNKALEVFMNDNLQLFLIDFVTILGVTALNSPIGKIISSLLISILTHNLSSINYADLAELLKYILYSRLADRLDERITQENELGLISTSKSKQKDSQIDIEEHRPLARRKQSEDRKEADQEGTDERDETVKEEKEHNTNKKYVREGNEELLMKYKNLIKKSETVCQFLQHIHLICFSSDLNLKNSDINA